MVTCLFDGGGVKMTNLKVLSFAACASRGLGRGALVCNGRALTMANARAKEVVAVSADEVCQDVRGLRLRSLRMENGCDPAALATRACISLRQLYQLESGGHSLFYSRALRDQAGRRVAVLLGAYWDDLSEQSVLAVQVPQSSQALPSDVAVVAEPLLQMAQSLAPLTVGSGVGSGLSHPTEETLWGDPLFLSDVQYLDAESQVLDRAWMDWGWLIFALAGVMLAVVLFVRL